MRGCTRLSNGFSRKIENHMGGRGDQLLRLQLHQDPLFAADVARDRLRGYGAPAPHAQIMQELERVAGTQHDGYLTANFRAVIESSPFKVNGP
jgi:hypothetical protein